MAERDAHPSAEPEAGELLSRLVDNLVASYHADARTQHLDATFLPNRAKTIEILEYLRRLIFPGFFDTDRLSSANIRYHTGELLSRLHALLYDQIHQALRYELNRTQGAGEGDNCDQCGEQAADLTVQFLDRLPEIRRILATDVQATYDGDPAAISTDETIFCYPGVDAVFVHRIAHELYRLDVPLLPRIMSEYAHNETGIDIHPGAQIGESFCVDHGTGVVVGETSVIGSRVTLYQGVTLGALSTKGGQRWRGIKRHPTIENDVTIYGGAIILGGNTTIGEGAVIGGSVFITSSIPPGHTVTMRKAELQITPRKQTGKKQHAPDTDAPDDALDFQI
jgi:serine O-acetyltransferase